MSLIKPHTRKNTHDQTAIRKCILRLLPAAVLITGITNTSSRADYIPYIVNPADGYLVRLNSNTTLSEIPIKGTDGINYYQIGPTITLGAGSSNLSITGQVKCLGKVYSALGPNQGTYGPPDGAHHNFAMNGSLQRTIISGTMVGYYVTKNLVIGIDYSISTYWSKKSIYTCSGTNASRPEIVSASAFNEVLPFKLSFFLVNKPVDSQLYIPQTDLGGLQVYFSSRGSGYGPVIDASSPAIMSQTTIPLRLAPSVINIPSSCKTSTSTGTGGQLEIRHGTLNSLNYDNTVKEKITYSCNFSALTKVRLRLDYTPDSDPQKRLPMINTSDKTKVIYSDLNITDESTGQSGKELNINIRDSKTVTINSHLKGTNSEAGHYQGSAWLIATYD